MQIWFRDRPLVGRQVMLAHRYHGRVTVKSQRTDAQGRATFTLEGAGDYIVRLVHMEPTTERDTDRKSWWSSLTFSVSEDH